MDVSVRDRWPGIAPDQRAWIFDRYVQMESEHARGGVGLRVYLCRHIVELHGGTRTTTWPADGGTSFTLRLPA